MGTLYWFFYGTAFVIGILEIVAGELETGVIRFMAVSVKTFVLSLGSAYGLHMVMGKDSAMAWEANNCGQINLDEKWWRIPLYLLCSASALGQYRFPVAQYGKGLVVQLVGYEVQYSLFQAFSYVGHTRDYLDTASSNTVAAIASVLAAFVLSYTLDAMRFYYNARLLHRVHKFSPFGECMFKWNAAWIRITNFLGIGRESDKLFLDLYPRLKSERIELNDPNHWRSEITLSEDEERLLDEAIIAAEPTNIWSLLMPTVYQLVPGSLIARLWFNSIFPPSPDLLRVTDVNATETDLLYQSSINQDNVFSSLMVIAASLALGLLLGMGLQSLITVILKHIFCCCLSEANEEMINLREDRNELMNTPEDEDPGSEIFTVTDDDKKKKVVEEESQEETATVENLKKSSQEVSFSIEEEISSA